MRDSKRPCVSYSLFHHARRWRDSLASLHHHHVGAKACPARTVSTALTRSTRLLQLTPANYRIYDEVNLNQARTSLYYITNLTQYFTSLLCKHKVYTHLTQPQTWTIVGGVSRTVLNHLWILCQHFWQELDSTDRNVTFSILAFKKYRHLKGFPYTARFQWGRQMPYAWNRPLSGKPPSRLMKVPLYRGIGFLWFPISCRVKESVNIDYKRQVADTGAIWF